MSILEYSYQKTIYKPNTGYKPDIAKWDSIGTSLYTFY